MDMILFAISSISNQLVQDGSRIYEPVCLDQVLGVAQKQQLGSEPCKAAASPTSSVSGRAHIKKVGGKMGCG